MRPEDIHRLVDLYKFAGSVRTCSKAYSVAPALVLTPILP